MFRLRTWPFYGLNRINLLFNKKLSASSPCVAVPWSPSEDNCSITVAACLRLIVIGSILQLNGLQTFPDNQIRALKPYTKTMKHTFFCILSGFFFFNEEIQFVTFPSGEAQYSIKDSQFYAIKILNSLKRLNEYFFSFSTKWVS